MSIFKVPGNDDEECLRMVNSTLYGLGSSVFSGNQKRATAIGKRIRAGMTTVNDFAVNYLVQVNSCPDSYLIALD
jgi:acyl-CoA reductase-like NAD-dependent aldehyde dehydrogenase